jgi:hypothetical protein
MPRIIAAVPQACHWLNGATSPLDTTAISYAAFELRLEIERIGVEYLQAVNGGRIEQDDVRVIESFKRLENRIYKQDGHQGEVPRAGATAFHLTRPEFERVNNDERIAERALRQTVVAG